jgi:hypothetical protein
MLEITFSSGWQPVCPALISFILFWIAGEDGDGKTQPAAEITIATEATRRKMALSMMRIP